VIFLLVQEFLLEDEMMVGWSTAGTMGTTELPYEIDTAFGK
jgi:hypothetical protein